MRKFLTQYTDSFQMLAQTSLFLAFPTNSTFELELWSYDLWKQIMQQWEKKQQTEGHKDNN